jgi:hypothetical protein
VSLLRSASSLRWKQVSLYSWAEHSNVTANMASLCVSPISSYKWVHTSLTVLNTNMSDNDVRLQHRRWIKCVLNFKFTNNKLLVKNLEFAGDVSIFAVNLSAITAMPPARPPSWLCTQRNIFFLFYALHHYYYYYYYTIIFCEFCLLLLICVLFMSLFYLCNWPWGCCAGTLIINNLSKVNYYYC